MRFLCVLLLVGLVATPRSEPDVQSLVGAGETRQTLSGASSPALVGSSRATRGPVPGGVPPVRAIRVTGFATWFDAKDAHTAAAGPTLRKALGRHWRGSTVRVCADECVVVRLTDWCACGSRHGTPTVLDLDDVAFSRIAKLSAGVVLVRVTVLGQIDVPLTRPAPTAPPTDVQ